MHCSDTRGLAGLLASLLLGVVPALGQEIRAQASANRTRPCVAPCAVFFDARGSSHTELDAAASFLDLHYEWDFGDDRCGGGTWSASGKSKCRDFGPVAGHVYEHPGRYAANLRVSYRRHSASVRTPDVVVSDPAVVYTGARTTCVRASPESDFEGCPSGAKQITNDDLSAAIHGGVPAAGTRWLFRAGDSFHSRATVDTAAGGILVGAFGAGPKPIVHGGGTSVFAVGADTRFLDLDLRGDPERSVGQIAFTRAFLRGVSLFHEAVILRVDVRHYRGFASLWGGSNFGQFGNHHSNAIVECRNLERADGGVGFGAHATNLLFMGNDFGDAQYGQHTLRFFFLRGGVVSHNELGPLKEPVRHLIKLHANGGHGSPGCSGDVVIADNRLLGGESQTLAWFGPPDKDPNGPVECVERILYERNYSAFGGTLAAGTNRHVKNNAPDSAFRNNIMDLSSVRNYRYGIEIDFRNPDRDHGEPDPDNVRVLNNTCFTRDAPRERGSAICVRVDAVAAHASVHNNLLYAPRLGPNSQAVLVDDGPSSSTSRNRSASTNPFVAEDPTKAGDFRLAPAGDAAGGIVDGGIELDSNPWDFGGCARPEDGDGDGSSRTDVGAWEIPRGSCRGPTPIGPSAQTGGAR
jgi:hypothetical protein